jgi:hypothetical protein
MDSLVDVSLEQQWCLKRLEKMPKTIVAAFLAAGGMVYAQDSSYRHESKEISG